MVDTFQPREHAILAKFFGQEDKLPEDARQIDPEEIIPEDETYDEATQGIVCRKSYGDHDSNAIDNAGGPDCSGTGAYSLPTWGGFGKDGVFHSRQDENPIHCPSGEPERTGPCAFDKLGDIRRPGFSGLKYYISWIPYYEQYVVTVSYDSPEIEGPSQNETKAIGVLPEGALTDVEEDFQSVIVSHWSRLLSTCRDGRE